MKQFMIWQFTTDELSDTLLNVTVNNFVETLANWVLFPTVAVLFAFYYKISIFDNRFNISLLKFCYSLDVFSDNQF